MPTSRSLWNRCTAGPALAIVVTALAATGTTRADAQTYAQKRSAAVDYILTHSVREEMVAIPMRDGVRLSATILFPTDRPRRNLPTVLIFIPYLTESTIRGSFSMYIRSFIENGYAVIIENVRGRYFSEGTYTYLGGSGKDGYDSIDWISKQPWSNGKVGTLGCSSSAEEQHKMNAAQHPAHAAAVPMGSGAGIGRVGPYNEMGNFYRGGAVQGVWFSWYFGSGYKYHPTWPANLTRDQMLRINKFWNMEPELMHAANLDSAIWTLPLNKIMSNLGAMPSDVDDFVNRLPNDPKWKEIEFGGEGDRSGAPTLYINSWYDLSIGPNVAMFDYQTKNAANQTARDNIFMVIAPTLHCQEGQMESEHTVVGERDFGDARFDYVRLVQRWFDHWLTGANNGVTAEPKVRAYMMGSNEWRSYDSWQPKNVQPVSYYLDSDGRANTLYGNGRLTTTPPARAMADSFVYDPMHPTPSHGGQSCCLIVVPGGSFDQAGVEIRSDVLVYTTPVLTERTDVVGNIEVSLYLSSDVKDTDLMVKLVDVGPDGKAFNLDEGILRARWREGWDKPVFMERGKVYKVDLPPLVTSNSFAAGHRIRIEVASSSFPHFERNLNTGGNNYDEKDGLIAHNVIHHSPAYPSRIVLPILKTR
ncbi:MAG: CocE/NonD family hydrolase [Gemmatimonadaceae bacterium]|nr:CocE/NonD family hydrolase [Gemmatimonadaceae bacterium]NUS47326.1 CocE/NonD family hydrolase [Gemmatimonadaceae bacterium]